MILSKNGVIKVLDLGLARLHGEEAKPDEEPLTNSGQILGTPDYIAPEQWDDTHNVDGRCDLYALGCTLHFLLTGRAPFATQSTAAGKMKAHSSFLPPDLAASRKDAMSRPSTLGASATEQTQAIPLDPLPAGLAEIHAKLLAKDPNDRYARAADLSAALQTLEAVILARSLEQDGPARATPAPKASREADVPPRRPLLALLGAFFATAVLFAGIVIILKKPDGTERRVVVAPDETVVIERTQPGGKDSDAVTEADGPPELEAWLKGRKILTVRQDGKAQFTTVQAALDAQKDGEVVEILDRGPYYETLRWGEKRDCGLVSRAGAVIIGREWIKNDGNPGKKILHHFFALSNCRLSGISLLAQNADAVSLNPLMVFKVQSLCIEDCVLDGEFQQDRKEEPYAQFFFEQQPDGSPAQVHLRRSVFGYPVQINPIQGQKVSAILSRNWWRGQSSIPEHPVIVLADLDVRVTQNVFTREGSGRCLGFGGPKGMAGTLRRSFDRNTFAGRTTWVGFSFTGLPGEQVTFRDNVMPATGAVAYLPKEVQGLARKHWTIARNIGGSPDDSGNDEVLPLASELNRVPVKYLSTDPADRNYLRLDPVWVKARIKPGDPVPGALLPGPCPEDGDWFTRLQQRYAETQKTLHPLNGSSNANRSEVPEPPELEAWLKGRKILTVKQDGSARFTSIQAALDAQQDGDVVEVLDRGPYRENLIWSNKQDCGLVSRVGTILYAAEWKENAGDPKARLQHLIGNLEQCRLSGLSFVFNATEPAHTAPVVVFDVSEFCIEDCAIVSDRERVSGGPHQCCSFFSGSRGDGVDTTVVRRCVFDTTISTSMLPTSARYRVTNNWWVGRSVAPETFSLDTESNPGLWVGNVFSREGEMRAISFGETRFVVGYGVQRYERNTFAAEATYVAFTYSGLPGKDVAFVDNLLPVANGVVAMPEKVYGSAKTQWTIRGNRGGGVVENPNLLPLAAAEDRSPVKYLSTDLLHRDYLRLDPEWVKTHVKAGDTVPGALPPGPCPPEGDWFTRMQERYRALLEFREGLPK
jgi:hypothetical protein